MKFTRKVLFTGAAVAAATFIFYSCQKSVKPSSSLQASSQSSSNFIVQPDGPPYCGTPVEVPLTAGQTIPAGTVVLGNDVDNLYVTYNTTDGWKIKELHLNVICDNGGDCTVGKSSDLAPGKFPYSKVFSTAANNTSGCNADQLPDTYTFVIPRSSLGDCGCFCIYPHASLTKCTSDTTADAQTAWGGTINRITNGKWYGGTNYCYQDCQ